RASAVVRPPMPPPTITIGRPLFATTRLPCQYTDYQCTVYLRLSSRAGPGVRMTTDPLYAKPGHLIRRCQQIAVALFMEEAGADGFDVTPVQYAALAAIGEHPGIEAAAL